MNRPWGLGAMSTPAMTPGASFDAQRTPRVVFRACMISVNRLR